MEQPKYRRVLLKISGEALAGDDKYGLNFDVLNTVAAAIKECCEAGAQIGLVVGGGNIWRGVKNGSGSPYFSTDTAAALRAAEIHADALLLAKNIDGVYDADPAKVPDAKKFDEISYAEVLRRGLGVMDTTATALAMDNNIPVVVFALKDPGNIKRVLMGEKLGTYVGTDVE